MTPYKIKSEERQTKDIAYLNSLRFLNPDKYFYELQLTNKVEGADTQESANEADRVLSENRATFLAKNPINGPLTTDTLKSVHGYLFQDIYYCAGKTRDVQMQIDDITVFEVPSKIVKSLDLLFQKLGNENQLKGLDRTLFCERIADYWSEYIAIHPFREGNGRAGRMVFSQLASEAGWNINWKAVSHDEWVMADECAYDSRRDYGKENKDTSYLQNLFNRAISSTNIAGVCIKQPSDYSAAFLEQMQGMDVPRPQQGAGQKITDNKNGNIAE